eukprot:590772-Heterocapsa_arctica.AAC.1
MNDSDELMSKWLNMIKGVDDLENLPLNTSCETLQHNVTLYMVKTNLVKKCLKVFVEIVENSDDYKKFYEPSGKCPKLGVHTNFLNRTKMAELLRWRKSKSSDK